MNATLLLLSRSNFIHNYGSLIKRFVSFLIDDSGKKLLDFEDSFRLVNDFSVYCLREKAVCDADIKRIGTEGPPEDLIASLQISDDLNKRIQSINLENIHEILSVKQIDMLYFLIKQLKPIVENRAQTMQSFMTLGISFGPSLYTQDFELISHAPWINYFNGLFLHHLYSIQRLAEDRRAPAPSVPRLPLTSRSLRDSVNKVKASKKLAEVYDQVKNNYTEIDDNFYDKVHPKHWSKYIKCKKLDNPIICRSNPACEYKDGICFPDETGLLPAEKMTPADMKEYTADYIMQWRYHKSWAGALGWSTKLSPSKLIEELAKIKDKTPPIDVFIHNPITEYKTTNSYKDIGAAMLDIQKHYLFTGFHRAM